MKTESNNVFRVTKPKAVRAATAATWVIVAVSFAAIFEYVGRYTDASWLRLRGGRTCLSGCDGATLAVSRVLDVVGK